MTKHVSPSKSPAFGQNGSIERVFSRAGFTLSTLRCNLIPDTADRLVVMNDNLDILEKLPIFQGAEIEDAEDDVVDVVDVEGESG